MSILLKGGPVDGKVFDTSCDQPRIAHLVEKGTAYYRIVQETRGSTVEIYEFEQLKENPPPKPI